MTVPPARTKELHDRLALTGGEAAGSSWSRWLTPALALVLLTGHGSAQTVINGDLDGVADFSVFNGVAPPGWMGTFMGSDLLDVTSTFVNQVWLPSTGGGTFVHGIGFNGFEWISQQVTGLTVGAQYTVSFEQSITNSDFTTHPSGFWQVDFGPDTLDSSLMTTPPLGTGVPWQPQALTFTASATSQLLRFTARKGTPLPVGQRSDVGLDTVRIDLGCGLALPGFQNVRLGTPPNPLALIPPVAGPPVIGTVWDPFIDHSSFVPGANLDVYLISMFPVNIPMPPAGTLLCTAPFFSTLRLPTDSLALQIPGNCALVDLRLCVWAASFEPSGAYFLTNAIDAFIGSI